MNRMATVGGFSRWNNHRYHVVLVEESAANWRCCRRIYTYYINFVVVHLTSAVATLYYVTKSCDVVEDCCTAPLV